MARERIRTIKRILIGAVFFAVLYKFILKVIDNFGGKRFRDVRAKDTNSRFLTPLTDFNNVIKQDRHFSQRRVNENNKDIPVLTKLPEQIARRTTLSGRRSDSFYFGNEDPDSMYKRLDILDIFTAHPLERIQEDSDSITGIGERNYMRLGRLQQSCQILKNSTERREQPRPILRSFMDPNHDITWCLVNKIGSTYTYGVFENIFHSTVNDMFQIADEVRALPYLEMRRTIANSHTMMFVREPFGRLFSTYSNKFYFPKDHWAPVGPDIVQKCRNSPSHDSLIYGHDVTFEEMIRYTVEEFEAGRDLDVHLRPMNEQCYPCDYRYDFIGKLETFATDWNYLKSEWARRKHIEIPADANQVRRTMFREVHKMKITIDLIKDSDISLYKVHLRAWNYFKIGGKVYKHIDMPFKETSYINYHAFQRALEDAAEQSKPYAEEMKRQKEEALRQAYASVPLHLLERLRRVLALDCALYGYDDRPDWIFNRENVQNVDFNYFQGLE